VDGALLHLTPLAHQIATRLRAEFPDEEAEYGDAGLEWCVHDNRWLLGWAAEAEELGQHHFDDNVRWLAGLLAARNYPLERLARDLEIAADLTGDHAALSATLLGGAEIVRRTS
jgi:hypothetical protein